MLIFICLKLNKILNTNHRSNLIENNTMIPLTRDKFVLEPESVAKIKLNKIILGFNESISNEHQQYILSFYD